MGLIGRGVAGHDALDGIYDRSVQFVSNTNTYLETTRVGAFVAEQNQLKRRTVGFLGCLDRLR